MTSRVLFVSSNGEGMGHLTRLCAVARRLPDGYEPVFLTLSSAVTAVRSLGFWIDYIPSRTASGLDLVSWTDYLARRVSIALEALRPRALVFDGIHPYGGLVGALARFPAVRRVWIRRGMWKPLSAAAERRAARKPSLFDLVIEPGELAAAADHGFTARHRGLVRRVDPIVLLEPGDMLPRDAARAELGIAPDALAVLFNLGGGELNRVDGVLAAAVRTLERQPRVEMLAVESPIAQGALPAANRFRSVRIYPLARLLHAFDLSVAAAGYNSFHEHLAAGVPTVFVPQSKQRDDQAARAAWAAQAGAALMSPADDAAALARALDQLVDPAVRERLGQACLALPPCVGGRQAADLVGACIDGPVDRDARRDRLSRAAVRGARGVAAALRAVPRPGRAAPVLASATDLAAAVRSGAPAELDVEIPPGADDLAAYARDKAAALKAAYGGAMFRRSP